MSDFANHNSEEVRARQRSVEQERNSEHQREARRHLIPEVKNASRLASSSAIRGRGNGPAYVGSMLNMQKTHGNRAIQRWVDTGGWSRFDDLYKQVPVTSGSFSPPKFPRPSNPINPRVIEPLAPNPYAPPGTIPTTPGDPWLDPAYDPSEPFNPDNFPSPVLEGEEFA
jgi:hypothetical protein